MERRRRNEEKLVGGEDKRLIYIVIVVLIVAVLAFVITFLVYSNNMSVNPEGTGIGQIQMKPVLVNQMSNEQTSEVSSSVGKNVNEMMENDVKIAINTTNMEKEKVTEESKKAEKNEAEKDKKEQTEESTKENKEPVEEKDPVFTKPVDGEVNVNFAKDNLVYSETLQEWVTHNGIDINAEKATVVKASADGTVKAIKNDPRYGITVILQHQNGYETVYSNLLTAEFVKEGENVTSGQTLGTVGNTATFEIAQEPHLHFEILKDGENVDPNLYIK